MKHFKIFVLALTLACASSLSSRAELAAANAPFSPQPATVNPASALSPGARDIVKLVSAGLSDEVVKAYVQNANYLFDLSADNIVQLKGMGVSPAVMVGMLVHDKTLHESARVNAPPVAAAPVPVAQPSAPAAAPAAPYTGATVPTDTAIYSNLAPYGTWGNSPDYGWYWQPYSTVAYDFFPTTWLGYGYWWDFPGRGLCWFPHSRFRDFDRIGRFHDFDRFRDGRFGFAGNRFGGVPFHSHSVGAPASFGVSTGINGFHSWMRSGGYFGGGFSRGGFGHGGFAHSGFHGGRR